MNSQVVKRMMTFIIDYQKVTGQNSLGDKTSITASCRGYIKEEMKAITDTLGNEVKSSVQVFLNGADAMNIANNTSIDIAKEVISKQTDPETQQTTEITEKVFLYQKKTLLKKELFYKPNGTADVGVLYLP